MNNCDYASCGRAGTFESAGWVFCPAHLKQHEQISEEDELRLLGLRRRPLPKKAYAQCELKASYWRTAVNNLMSIEASKLEQTLFPVDV